MLEAAAGEEQGVENFEHALSVSFSASYLCHVQGIGLYGHADQGSDCSYVLYLQLKEHML